MVCDVVWEEIEKWIRVNTANYEKKYLLLVLWEYQ
jgi:hypothetical protein